MKASSGEGEITRMRPATAQEVIEFGLGVVCGCGDIIRADYLGGYDADGRAYCPTCWMDREQATS